MTLRILEELTQCAILAENFIGLIKQAVCKDLAKPDSPLVLWDYCVERRTCISDLTAQTLFQLKGTNPHLTIHNKKGDISNLCN